MSIDVMTKVLQRCPLAGSERLCLLIMANWCNDDGDSLYPSIALVAEAMQVSRSQAQRVLHRLMPAIEDDEWWIRVVGNKAGGPPGATRRYELNVGRLDRLPKLPEFERADERRRLKGDTGRVDATRRTGVTGRMDAVDGSHGCDPTGRTGATRLVKEPSDNHQKSARPHAGASEGKKTEPPTAPPSAFMKSHPELFGLKPMPGSRS